jgi:hypothetical protein
MAAPDRIQYYFKEDTNQILVSGSDTVANTNAFIIADKNPNTVFNSNLSSKIVNYGTEITYYTQNGPDLYSLGGLLTNFSEVWSSTQQTSAPINVIGDITGVNASVTVRTGPVGGGPQAYRVNKVNTIEGGNNWTVGETFTITQSQLTSAGFSNVSADLIVTITTVSQGSTPIPLKSDQELWVYRGYNTEGGDGNTSRYNPHLHRPYKAYIVVETGSGTPVESWSPPGNPVNTGAANNSGGNIPNALLERQLAIVGNETPDLQSNSIRGSFTVGNQNRRVHPWVFTKYNQLTTPPIAGAAWNLYKENNDKTYPTVYTYSTSNTFPSPANQVRANNNNFQTTTQINIEPPAAADGYPGEWLLWSIIYVAYENGKRGAKLRLQKNGNPLTKAVFNIDSISRTGTGIGSIYTFDVTLESSIPAGLTEFNNGQSINVSLLEFPLFLLSYQQSQFANVNTEAFTFSTTTLETGFYTYTSSAFLTQDSNGNDAIGSSQFGLFTELGYYVGYNAENNSGGDVRVKYTGSQNMDSLYFDLPTGKNANFLALAGTITQSGYTTEPGDPVDFNLDGTYDAANFDVTITQNNSAGQPTPPPETFAKRWESVYISYSSSLSASIDGLYVFNQLPQNDIQVTCSMFLESWSEEAAGDRYDIPTSTYGTALYQGNEEGNGPTWQTASIRIYTGSYPLDVPIIGGSSPNDTFLHEESFSSLVIHTTGLAITTSFTIPSQSIEIKDCLSVALQVSSGSYPPESVENSLIVKDYYIEFNTPSTGEEGDGLVPTFIENAFSGTDGFNNTPDCQPILNNVSVGVANDRIQEVDYTTGIYDPINFEAIIEGTAVKSTIPELFYTSEALGQPRFLGSRSNNKFINKWSVGDTGTLGKTPSIELRDAFFGYFNDLSDPYPNINGVTRINLNYLIDEQGNALPPSLEPITIDTFEAVFPNTTNARLAVKSGKTQYKDLGRPSPIKNSMQYVTPILYSQNSSNNYTNIIPLSGSGYISRYDNDDGAGQVFGRFTAMGECSVNTSTPTQTVDYYLNPNNVDIVQGSTTVYADNGQPDAYYNPTAWNIIAGDDLRNQQIISLNTSIVTTFVSETNRTRDELQFELIMYSGWNGTNGSDPQGFNLEDIECKVYTQAGQVQNIGSVLQYGWFNISNIAGYNTIIQEDDPFRLGNFSFPRWKRTKVPITSSGIVCTADWEMFETLFDLGLMRERNPRNGSGVVALEWVIKANSGKYDIKSGDKINWRVKGFFKDSRGGDWKQGLFFPSTAMGYTGENYTSTTLIGQGALDHLLDEANTAQAPFWVKSNGLNDSDFNASLANRTLIMSSSNMNEAYGTAFQQGFVEYIPGPSPYFPGNVEPEGTNFDPIKSTIELKEGDEIRFANNENFTYKIVQVFAPSENVRNNLYPNSDKGRLKIRLDRDVDDSINLDFFFVRRPFTSPNNIYLNTPFPYEALASASISQSIKNISDFPDGAFALNGGVDASGEFTASFSSLEMADTPGILFPDYPTQKLIDSASIIVSELIDKGIIES